METGAEIILLPHSPSPTPTSTLTVSLTPAVVYIPASGTSYTLTGLEEGAQYSITVSVSLGGNGGTLEASTTATTLTAG